MSEITKWEYLEKSYSWYDAISLMQSLGQQGWEFCESVAVHTNSSHRFYYFKRPIK